MLWQAFCQSVPVANCESSVLAKATMFSCLKPEINAEHQFNCLISNLSCGFWSIHKLPAHIPNFCSDCRRRMGRMKKVTSTDVPAAVHAAIQAALASDQSKDGSLTRVFFAPLVNTKYVQTLLCIVETYVYALRTVDVLYLCSVLTDLALLLSNESFEFCDSVQHSCDSALLQAIVA
jgi:hypothetical protein